MRGVVVVRIRPRNPYVAERDCPAAVTLLAYARGAVDRRWACSTLAPARWLLLVIAASAR